MKKTQMEDTWKNSLFCALIVGSAVIVGSGAGGKATEVLVNQESEIIWESEVETESEMETESEPETESIAGIETEVDAEIETGIESEVDAEIETGMESEMETESETGLESEVETESEMGIEFETETDNGSETESETEMKMGKESEIETGTETESEEEVKTETEIKTESDREGETETVVETESEAATESETATEREAATERGAATESEAVTESKAATESGAATESEAATESGAATESEAETEPEAVTESETETENEVKTERETEMETERAEETEPEKKPEQLYRGKDYEISGDYNAYFRDENGKLWIRSGTGVHIEPRNGNVSEKRIGMNNLQEDGKLTFSLLKKDQNGVVLGASAVTQESYYVDNSVPAAEIFVGGTVSDGIVFTGKETKASVQVRPDTMSGMKKITYQVTAYEADGTAGELSENTDWKEWNYGQSIMLPEEGTFRIFVRTEDRVGNVAFAGSQPVCVDLTPPVVDIKGVQDQTANSGTLPISVVCKDPSYAKGSLTVDILGVNTKKRPEVQVKQEQIDGAFISFYDFPQEQTYDDVYRMLVSASDKSGNKTERMIEFSVNRYGSVYKLSDPTVKELEDYFVSEGKDIVFYETNIDYVGESSVFVRHNGELKELRRGLDYQVTMSGSENTWKKYSYTVPADCFQEEGVYELLLASVDQAENTSDTGMQEQSVAFVLDHTKPNVIISGIEDHQTYESEAVTIAITPSDTGGVKNVGVYINGELEQEYTEVKTDETIYYEIKEKPEWQKIQISVTDMAGNMYRSEELSVLISREEFSEQEKETEKEKEMEVSDDPKKEVPILFWSGITAFILAIISCDVIRKRKEK